MRNKNLRTFWKRVLDGGYVISLKIVESYLLHLFGATDDFRFLLLRNYVGAPRFSSHHYVFMGLAGIPLRSNLPEL